MTRPPAENLAPMIRAFYSDCSCLWARIKLMVRILLVSSPLRHLGAINRSPWFARTVCSIEGAGDAGTESAYTPLYSEGRALYRWGSPPAKKDDSSGRRDLKRHSDKKMALVAPAIFAVAEPDRCAQELQAYLLNQGLEASIHLIEDEENRASTASLLNAAIAGLKDSCDYFVFQPLSLIPETADYRWADAFLSLAEYCRTADGNCYQKRGLHHAALLAPKELLLAVDGLGEGPLAEALANLFVRACKSGYDCAEDVDGFFRWLGEAPDALASEDSEPTEFFGRPSALQVLDHRQETHPHYQHHRFRFTAPKP